MGTPISSRQAWRYEPTGRPRAALIRAATPWSSSPPWSRSTPLRPLTSGRWPTRWRPGPRRRTSSACLLLSRRRSAGRSWSRPRPSSWSPSASACRMTCSTPFSLRQQEVTMFRRRRPLLRAAAVGGGAYLAGKHVARGQEEQAQAEAEQNARLSDLEQQQQQPPPQQAPAQAPAASSPMIDQLNQLAALHQQGVLTDEEFAAAKAKLFSS